MGMNSLNKNIEVYVTIKAYIHLYYLLKVVKRGFDVYCIPPHLGVHFSLHKSGETHFRFEERAKKPGKELPVVLTQGEAGISTDKGIICTSLGQTGRATGICTALYPINSLSNDFQKFQKSAGECFVIDTDSFSEDINFVEIGVWAVPTRNQISFKFNVPNIPADLLYTVAQCEPQIWIYARPC
jgi:hypothetical protein